MYLSKILVFFLFIFFQNYFTLAQGQNKITIPLNKWTSQRVLSKAVGHIIEKLNVPVEYLNISAYDQWGALQRGVIHFQIEVWQPSMAKSFNKLVSDYEIIDMGFHKAKVTEDWWYPKYIEELCPDLPNWQALNKCKKLFSNSNSSNKGVYYAGPWDYGDADIIRALDLDFEIKRLPDEFALWEALMEATKNKRPILLLNWSPNWTDTNIEGQFIKFPSYTLACETQPEWGLNKKLVKDCGNPKNGWLKKAAWPKLKKNFPCVYQLIKNITLTNEMISDAAALVIVAGNSEDTAATLWLKKYLTQTKSWTKNVCKKAL